MSLQAELSAAGIKFVTQQTLASVTRVNDELGVELSDGSPVGVDAVIRAVGRRPNVQGLGLEAASVRTDDRGAIVVEEPIHVPTDADDAVLETCRQQVEAALNRATARAYAIADRKVANAVRG